MQARKSTQLSTAQQLVLLSLLWLQVQPPGCCLVWASWWPSRWCHTHHHTPVVEHLHDAILAQLPERGGGGV